LETLFAANLLACTGEIRPENRS